MTNDEKKDLLCALVDGKQGQTEFQQRFQDDEPDMCAAFAMNGRRRVRLKPEPRKMWVRWNDNGSVSCMTDAGHDTTHTTGGWHLITEPEKGEK